MDMLLPRVNMKRELRCYTCNIHTAYEALTNADNMVLHVINVNVTSQNYQISVKYILGVFN